MCGIANDGHADSGLFRLVDCQLHRLGGCQMPHGKMSVEQRGNRCFADNLSFCVKVDAAFFDVLMIVHHSLCAVALDAEQIRLHQYVGNLRRILFFKPFFFICALHKRAKLLCRYSGIHGCSFPRGYSPNSGRESASSLSL